MTLRTWSILLVIGLVYFIYLAGAHADFAQPSVWQQMQQSQGVNRKVLVKDLYFRTDGVIVELANSRQSKNVTRISLCADIPSNPSTNQLDSDATHAMFKRMMLEQLQRAKVNKTYVNVEVSGPWSPCLSSVRSVEG